MKLKLTSKMAFMFNYYIFITKKEIAKYDMIKPVASSYYVACEKYEDRFTT